MHELLKGSNNSSCFDKEQPETQSDDPASQLLELSTARRSSRLDALSSMVDAAPVSFTKDSRFVREASLLKNKTVPFPRGTAEHSSARYHHQLSPSLRRYRRQWKKSPEFRRDILWISQKNLPNRRYQGINGGLSRSAFASKSRSFELLTKFVV